jgi:hypothetical protein
MAMQNQAPFLIAGLFGLKLSHFQLVVDLSMNSRRELFKNNTIDCNWHRKEY